MNKLLILKQVRDMLSDTVGIALRIDENEVIKLDANSTSLSIDVVDFEETLYVRMRAVIAFNATQFTFAGVNGDYTIYEWCNDFNSDLYQGTFIHWPKHKHPKIDNLTVVQHHLLAQGLSADVLFAAFSLLMRITDGFSQRFIDMFGGVTAEIAQATILKTD